MRVAFWGRPIRRRPGAVMGEEEEEMIRSSGRFAGVLAGPLAWLAVGTLLVPAAPAQGAFETFAIQATGAKEVNAAGVPNQGDPDGSAVGTLTLDSGTVGNTGSATFNLTVANLDFPFTAFHIHQAPANTTGPIVLNFGNPETFRVGNVVSGTVPGLSSATIDAVFANPSGFYFNMHNGPFPAGAVRDQLTTPVPEPGSLVLTGIGVLAALGVGYRRRRAAGSA